MTVRMLKIRWTLTPLLTICSEECPPTSSPRSASNLIRNCYLKFTNRMTQKLLPKVYKSHDSEIVAQVYKWFLITPVSCFYGVTWRYLALPGITSRYLALSGVTWCYLALPGIIWQDLRSWTSYFNIISVLRVMSKFHSLSNANYFSIDFTYLIFIFKPAQNISFHFWPGLRVILPYINSMLSVLIPVNPIVT